MTRFDIFIIACSLASFLFGFLVPWWPLMALGIALLVLYGHTGLGVSAGLLFDVLWGAPPGAFMLLHFPFLLFAAVCVGVRALALAFILPRSGPLAL